MALRCRLAPLLRAYASEGTANAATNVPQKPEQQQLRRRRVGASVESTDTGEINELRKELARAQFRIAELQLSQVAAHDALLRRLDDTDKAAHKAAIELRYTALALQCHHDLLETELRRVLAIKPNAGPMTDDDAELLRRAAIEAGSREMVRRNIGFRVEKVSEEPAAVAKFKNTDTELGDKDSSGSNSASGGVSKSA